MLGLSFIEVMHHLLRRMGYFTKYKLNSFSQAEQCFCALDHTCALNITESWKREMQVDFFKNPFWYLSEFYFLT